MDKANARTIDKYHKKTKTLFYHMREHYNDQRLLSQILLFETTCFWTFTKLILKRFFANGIWNKVVQNPQNKVV